MLLSAMLAHARDKRCNKASSGSFSLTNQHQQQPLHAPMHAHTSSMYPDDRAARHLVPLSGAGFPPSRALTQASAEAAVLTGQNPPKAASHTHTHNNTHKLKTLKHTHTRTVCLSKEPASLPAMPAHRPLQMLLKLPSCNRLQAAARVEPVAAAVL
jgi:hypothetical protein